MRISIISHAARYEERRLFNRVDRVRLGGMLHLIVISRLLGLVFHHAPCAFCREMRGLSEDPLTHYRPSTFSRLQGSLGDMVSGCVNVSPPSPTSGFFLLLMSRACHLS